MHLRSSISQKISLLSQCNNIYADDRVVLKFFYFLFFIASLWVFHQFFMFVADSNLMFLYGAYRRVKFLFSRIDMNFDHCRKVDCLRLLHNITENDSHPFRSKLPLPFQPSLSTRYTFTVNELAFLLFPGALTNFPEV